jgi:hypothetical protein
MNCRQFEQAWNERLDRRDTAASTLDDPLARHAAACQRCRGRAQAFLALEQALAAWPAYPAAKPSPGSVDRMLEAWRGQQARTVAPIPVRRGRRHGWWGWAAAAALILATWLGYRLSPRSTDHGPSARAPLIATEMPPSPDAPATPTRPITVSLAEATSATIELARATSAPAARLGRQVIASTASATSSASRPDLLPRVPLGSASEVLRSVGEDLGDGVEPLSGTARKAFGFLLGPGESVDPESAKAGAGRGRGA